MRAMHVAFMRPLVFTAAVLPAVCLEHFPLISKVSNAMAMTWSVSSSLCIGLKSSESMHV